jgi:hypothetical protein
MDVVTRSATAWVLGFLSKLMFDTCLWRQSGPNSLSIASRTEQLLISDRWIVDDSSCLDDMVGQVSYVLLAA